MAKAVPSFAIPAVLDVVQIWHRDRDYRYPAKPLDLSGKKGSKEAPKMDTMIKVLFIAILALVLLGLLGRCELRIETYGSRHNSSFSQNDEDYWRGITGPCDGYKWHVGNICE